ncbi:UvrD-helicase domain-containing protein [Lutibacter sp.]
MLKSSPFQVYNASAGSGKTFSLVKEYLKIILATANVFKYQEILAVTFTNKAAGEMKERVIKNLHDFSMNVENEMLLQICNDLNVDKQLIYKRSKSILEAILQNYSGLNITTIDSFTHKLIKTFAHDLGLSLGFGVEMNADRLLDEAVDVIISQIGEDEELTELLVNYTLQKIDNNKSWDIVKELRSFSRITLNENDLIHLKKLKNKTPKDFKLLRDKLILENKKIKSEFTKIGQAGIAIIENSGVAETDFLRSGIPKHFKSLIDSKIKTSFFEETSLKKSIEEGKFYPLSKSDFVKKTIDGIIPELIALYLQSEKLYQQKTLNDLILNSLIPLAVLNHINKALQTIKEENSVLLNAEFNKIINDSIKDEPAPFIYERIGEKINYYFIDEMQDTSVLQWENLIPLIDNAISSENEFGEQGKLVLVGDAKQSIYRWRGGKAEQFISLATKEVNPFHVSMTLKNLETNFRSYSEVITFNNNFFKNTSKIFKNETYESLYLLGNNQKVNNKQGGYVELSFIESLKDKEERDVAYSEKVLQIIQDLEGTFQKNEICVLVRKKSQGVAVATHLLKHNIEIISSETLLLKNNEKIKFIINLLCVLQDASNKEHKIKILHFLYEYLEITEAKHSFYNDFVHLPNEMFFNNLRHFGIYFNYETFLQNTFYESIEYIVRSFKLATSSDSSIQFFLDFVFEFQQENRVSINEFLDFWEIKKENLSIVAPEVEDAVRIMTIHKAKGLEFPVVIFPYDLDIYKQMNTKVWYSYNQSSTIKSILINYNKKLSHIGDQGEALFRKKREELELDNINLLYVALTRAVEQLYVVSEKRINNKGEENQNYYAGLFINYLKNIGRWNENVDSYSFGKKIRYSEPKKEKQHVLIQEKIISDSWKNQKITITTSSSLLWDTTKGDSIEYGNLIHEILSKIYTKDDVPDVINQYAFGGLINESEKKNIVSIVENIVNNKDLEMYFSQNQKVFNEQKIVTEEKHIIIPDRLVINQNNAVIIDYKTGKPDSKYHQQLENYAMVLEKMGYVVEKKILVYINTQILVKEI